MKKLLLFSSITLALVAPLLADEVLYIQNFENNSEDIGDTDLGKAIADMVITDLVSLDIDGIKVVERDRIQSLLSELKLQESEYFDQATTQKMGKGLGADYALAGALSIISDTMRIDARLIDVETSEVISAFKSVGDKEKVYELEEQLVKGIERGLKINVGSLSRDKLSSPEKYDTLVKYADADKLMEQGDYKAATKVLGEVRKSEPEFKLGKEAYMGAMRNMYAARKKRETSFADNLDKLQASALEKRAKAIEANDSDRALAYSIVQNEINHKRLLNLVGISTPLDSMESSYPNIERTGIHSALEWLPPYNNEREYNPIEIPKEKIEEFQSVLGLFVEMKLSCIDQLKTYASRIQETERKSPFWYFRPNQKIDAEDRPLMGSLNIELPSYVPSQAPISSIQAELAHYLLYANDFTPAPYQLDEKYEKIGWELLDQATEDTLDERWPVRGGWTDDYADEDEAASKAMVIERRRGYSRKIMTMHGALLLAHGRLADAVGKWQEILDEYPDCEEFDQIEGKIWNVLK